MAGKSFPVLLLTAFFALHSIAALARLALNAPSPISASPNWRTLVLYGGSASYLSYLCWHQSPRGRFAAYLFLTVDIIRGLRGGQWWAVYLDLAVILILQMPAFRAAFPSIQPAHFRRYRLRQPPPLQTTLDPQHGPPPTGDRGQARLR
jgi:hypothetical protein